MSNTHNNSILDYCFIPGQRAKLFYWSGESLEQSHCVIVEIVEEIWLDNDKWYAVKIHKSILPNTTLKFTDVREEHFNYIDEDYAVFMADPDELGPAFRQLELVVDNTI